MLNINSEKMQHFTAHVFIFQAKPCNCFEHDGQIQKLCKMEWTEESNGVGVFEGEPFVAGVGEVSTYTAALIP